MSDAPNPNRPIPQPDLSQQQNPKAPPPVDPAQVRQADGGSNLQRILGYFESQGVTDDNHVVATVAGLPLRLSDLKGGRSPSPPPSPPPPPPPEDEA